MGIDTASGISGDRHQGVPVSGPNLNSRDQFEYGSVSTLTRQGRYKSFATAFSARPIVILSPLRSPVGSASAILMGTPNVGSFRARLVVTGGAGGDGTVNTQFIAMGAR